MKPRAPSRLQRLLPRRTHRLVPVDGSTIDAVAMDEDTLAALLPRWPEAEEIESQAAEGRLVLGTRGLDPL